MAFLDQRCRQPEIMDQPDLLPARLYHALLGLERINFFSGSVGILWPSLAELARRRERPLRVLDIATGGGDNCTRLWQRARRAGFELHIDGCDFNPLTVEYAQNRARQSQADVRFFRHDATTGDLPADYDVLISSLFLHHLDEEQAIDLLARMRAAARDMVLVNDLRRCRLGYLFAYVGTRLLSRSDVTHIDGPLSVKAAFTLPEAVELARRAGLAGATVSKRWPCRFLLQWQRGTDSTASQGVQS